MRKDQLIDMIGEAPDAYVADAAQYKKNGKKHRLPRWVKWPGVAAAVLALALLVNNLPGIPLIVSAHAVSKASESRKPEYPKGSHDSALLEEWVSGQEARSELIQTAQSPISDFAALVSDDVLSGRDDANLVWSPINAYIALAITAELTGSETQAQLLTLLGAPDTAALRSRISAVWEEIHADNGKEISVLANSLWLDEDVEYVKEKMDSIAYDYYASVYQGDLGSEKTNRAMTNWMRNQTGGLLKDRTQKCRLEPKDQVMAVASTIYFQSKWADPFDASDSGQGVFHAATGDREVTFMNKKESQMNYYWGEDYGAVQLFLENGSSMWFILPDEGKSIEDVLAGSSYMAMITQSAYEEQEASNRKWMKVNLSVPRFDVSASADLKEALQASGLTKIFEMFGNDFSPSIRRTNTPGNPVYLDSINQDSRVKIDEEGVAAASYIELNFGSGAPMPPDEIIDFVLDRPFVFAITKSRLPLFVGAVNAP